MERTKSGTVNIKPMMSRRRCSLISCSRAIASASSAAPPSSIASKPAAETARRNSACVIMVGTYLTRAFSVVNVTCASRTPSSLTRAFSRRRASLSSDKRLMTRSASPVATPYPARLTRVMKSPNPNLDASKSTVARSEERFTTALSTPSSFFKLRSTVATQLAQVMPVMGSVSCFVSAIETSLRVTDHVIRNS